MSTFADKYANAPAIREIAADEVEPGMVVRMTKTYEDHLAVAHTVRVVTLPGSETSNWDRYELIEDAPDPREELAKRLFEAYVQREYPIWDILPDTARRMWLNVVDEVIRWHEEQVEP